MESGVKMLMRESKKIEYLAKKGLFRKLICYYILVVILLTSITLTSNAQMELSIPVPKIKDDTSSNSDSSTTVTKDDTSSTSDSTTVTKDAEDKYIDTAVDWLNDNYDNASSYDNSNDKKNIETTKIEIKVEKEIGNISVGEKVIVKSEESEQISIDSLEFVPSTNLKKVKFTIAKLEDKPEEITEEPTVNGTIYVYLDIKLTSNDTYLHEEEFESMKFEFKVEKTWIDENNIDKETVTLVRYHDGWQPLKTIILSEDDNYMYYESETPGLSTYTVVGTQIVEASPALIKEKTVIPITGWIAIISISSMILIGVVYKLRFVYKSE